ncbi:MAG TPA: ferritin [Thermoanaerobaculia bacterium]|nr:ferritin [Thermoanaerobaculia bacterium]
MLKPSDKLTKAFTQQIGNEMGASMQYVAIGNYFTAETLPGLAAFFYRQADEERQHAMKFVKFLLDAGAYPEIPAIKAPKCHFKSAEECVALSVEWEETVTEQIYGLVELARKDNHYVAQRFLDWFVTEQLEEVSSMSDLLAIVRRAGEGGLLHVEDYLARQGVAAPAGGEET